MSRRIVVLLSASLAFFLLSATCSHGQRLPEDEVQALQAIAEQLGKTNWNTSVNPCTGQYPWAVDEDNNVTCACSLSSTTCHVVSISLKSQSLRGTLPPDFVRLPYLVSLDLTRNYLSGSIPREWGSMANIQYISLLGNNLIGRIPEEIGNISTLRSLYLENNELEGQLPPQLGNLPRIERMLLSSNSFSGELPPSFANLKTLIDVRLSDNTFTGKIPDFIGNWTNLTKLTIHGSGLWGPIPSSIGVLKKLVDLRITDLDGIESPFPNLSSTSMKTMILRNCNLVGELPSYLAGWSYLNMLDVSFNKLIGKIPSNYATLDLEYLYLTGNQLTGSVPNWTTTGMWDLSYNNFTGSFDCQVKNVNLFTTSSVDNKSGIASCMKISRCPRRRNNLYINCGGKELTFESSTYMEDMDPGAPARFYTKDNPTGLIAVLATSWMITLLIVTL